MDKYATEEQQVEAIKRFWKENGSAIIIGAVLGLGGLWGWRYYSDSQMQAKEQASTQYQAAIESVAEDKGLSQLQAFADNNTDNGYGDIATLIAARQLVDEGKLEEAASQLKGLLTRLDDAHLKALTSVRLARLQLELEQPEQALSTLEGVTSEAFAALVAEARGDAYVLLGQQDDARMAYTEALESESSNQLIQMKLDNLAVATGA